MKTEAERSDTAKNIKDYNDFVGQIEIVDVCLISAKIDNFGYAKSYSEMEFGVREKSWYENRENHIDAFHRYNLTAKDAEGRQTIAKVSMTFVATYRSEVAMTDEIFQTFKERNLPLNTWPYFREFAQGSFARMGWTGVVAPVHKIVVSRSKAK